MNQSTLAAAVLDDLIFSDDFNVPDDPAAFNNGYNNWSFIAPAATPTCQMGIIGGKAYVSQNPTFEIMAFRNAGQRNVAASVVFPNNDMTSGLFVCAPPVPNVQTFYSFGLEDVQAPAIYRASGGTWTKMGGYAFGSALPGGYEATLEVSGNYINGYINGNLIISAFDPSPLTGTYVGIRNGNVTAGYWDNFKLRRR